MKIRIFTLIFFIACYGSLMAQCSTQEYTLTQEIIAPSSISSISIQNGKLYMPAERCKKIFVADIEQKTIVDTIIFSCKGEVEIEGSAWYNNKLYLLCEKTSSIYQVTGNNKKIVRVKHNFHFPEQIGSRGLEGIAVNNKLNKFYILLEEDKHKKSALIYTFSVDTGGLYLKYESVFPLELGSGERFADICLNAAGDKIICLKSNYISRNLYELYSLPLNDNGDITGTLSLVLDLSSTMPQCKKNGYNTNIEGIVCDAADTIYIVSDNADSNADCKIIPSEPGKYKKTLLLKAVNCR